MKPNQKILSLLTALPPDVSINRCVEHDSTVEFYVSWPEPRGEARVCPSCGGHHCVTKDSGTMQTVRHLPAGSRPSMVTFHKPRFLCRDCGRTFYVRPTWVVPDISVTSAVFLAVYEKLTSTSHSLTEIARETNTSVSIVRSIIDHIELGPPSSLPETLGIDEFLGNSGSYDPVRKRYLTEKYHCVITNASAGAVIDILYKATFADLHAYFSGFPLSARQRVKFFCADMRPGFSKVARACFPQAKICIDPFHVVKLITSALGEVRVDEWRRLKDRFLKTASRYSNARKENRGSAEVIRLEALMKQQQEDYELVKNSQKLLTTSPYNENRFWNLNTERGEEKMERIFALSPDLETAHDALMGFYDIREEKDFGSRRAALSDWLGQYLTCECPPIRRAAQSIRFHRKGIENAWRYGKSNSPTEGLNKRIKDVKRLAFGAHDFENFRKRALLACGYVSFIKAPYTIFEEKRSGTDIPTKERRAES